MYPLLGNAVSALTQWVMCNNSVNLKSSRETFGRPPANAVKLG